MSAGPAEVWFHNAVIDGVQRLYALNLADRPAAEVLPLTAVTWVEVLWTLLSWDEAQDMRRLAVAFMRLAAAADRWPAPMALRKHLPARRVEVAQLDAPRCPPPADWRARWPALRTELLGIDRARKPNAVSGNIRGAEQADADTAGTGME
jgi:hypothetical protein